jgi:phosphatidylglycerol:prolipoprotein diacylglycerol transferase
MYPTLIDIDGYIISSYGTAIIFAFVVSIIPVLIYFPRKILTLADIYNFCLIVIAAIFFGGPLIQLSQDFNLNAIKEIFQFWNRKHEFASFPTLLATLIMIYVYCKIKQIPVLATLDFLFPYAILALGIQRIFGCFSAGCCYGLPTKIPWGMHFPDLSPAGKAFPLMSVHPTQLYYGLSAWLIFIFLLSYKRYYKDNRQVGEITAMGLMLLSITYFIVTFFRGDIMPILGISDLTFGQQVALGIFSLGTLLYMIVRLRMPSTQKGID